MGEEKPPRGPEPGATLSNRWPDRAIGISAGIFVGPVYILIVIFLLREFDPTALGTYSFLGGGSLAFTLLTALVSKNARPRSFAVTMAAITLLGGVLHVGGIEKGLCFVIMLGPFVMLGGLVSFFISRRRLNAMRSKVAQHKTSAFLLLSAPLVGALLEDHYLSSASSRQVSSSVVVSASADSIWRGIVEVAPFTDSELPPTWLQKLDVPRPVYASISNADGHRVRIGHFEGGLKFRERVTTYAPERELGLTIENIDYEAAADSIARHAFSDGFVRIDDVRYQLEPSNGQWQLRLSCTYTVRTTVTHYAQFIGDAVIRSFQRELLAALASRFERRAPRGGTPLLASAE